MLFYTWKDVDRYIQLNQKKWQGKIIDIEVYFSEIIVYLSSLDDINGVEEILTGLFENKYDPQDSILHLDLGDDSLNILFEQSEEVAKNNNITPLFNKVLYQETAYYEEMLTDKSLAIPVIAFHSYKGGVGRTLSLLAFAKAWSSLAEKKKLLIVDSDIEAPGLTWLSEQDRENFSYLDLLEIIQGQDDIDVIIDLVSDKIASLSITIDTELMKVEHILLPTYRYFAQLLDMYSSPESIVNSYNKKYIIAEVLSALGEKLGASAVLIDLRAGISEFSAPILFDPRVKKYIVTSTSYQSIKGTELLLEQLNKGLPIEENTVLPEIFISMVPEGFKTDDIISDLVAIYDQGNVGREVSLTDNLVTELPFASELVHLESLEQIMKSLEGRDFYKKIYSIVKNSFLMDEKKVVENKGFNREDVIYKINTLSKSQITAEGNVDFNILMTQPISNLIKKFSVNVPTVVVMGAKGSGKTFLYREILKKKYWENFSCEFSSQGQKTDSKTLVIPLLASQNAKEFNDILQDVVANFNSNFKDNMLNNSYWIDNGTKVKEYLREEHDDLEWNYFWKNLILSTVNGIETFEEFEIKLKEKNRRVVFLVDGLEEILVKTLTDRNEKDAVKALCQDTLNEISAKYKNIGCLIFLRKDLARSSIETNFEQFNTLYRSVELNWSRTEALRLVVWLVNQAFPGFYNETIDIEVASADIIEKNLIKLWGLKLGKANSNEAYCSRWILAALSDFNGQLQARDIIRFLMHATESVGKNIYDDRIIMPTEIKKAVSNCSSDKISEVKQEIEVLKPIFDKLDNAPEEKKTLPFRSDTFELSSTEEKLLKQEGYLRIDNDKYYLPEIVRHALKFKYEKGARPKVLSLLLNG